MRSREHPSGLTAAPAAWRRRPAGAPDRIAEQRRWRGRRPARRVRRQPESNFGRGHSEAGGSGGEWLQVSRSARRARRNRVRRGDLDGRIGDGDGVGVEFGFFLERVRAFLAAKAAHAVQRLIAVPAGTLGGQALACTRLRRNSSGRRVNCRFLVLQTFLYGSQDSPPSNGSTSKSYSKITIVEYEAYEKSQTRQRCFRRRGSLRVCPEKHAAAML